MTAEREYLGRQLDDAVIQRADRLGILAPTMSSHILLIQEDMRLLERLLHGEAFTLVEKARLEELGYSSVL